MIQLGIYYIILYYIILYYAWYILYYYAWYILSFKIKTEDANNDKFVKNATVFVNGG